MTDREWDIEFEVDPQVIADMMHRGLMDALAGLYAIDPRRLDRGTLGEAIFMLYELRDNARKARP